jgi:general stress protein YciG
LPRFYGQGADYLYEICTDKSNQTTMAENTNNTSRRGFASMDPARQREIASMGGREAHARGTAHEFDSNEAREAGRKGGMNSGRSNRDRGGMTNLDTDEEM